MCVVRDLGPTPTCIHSAPVVCRFGCGCGCGWVRVSPLIHLHHFGTGRWSKTAARDLAEFGKGAVSPVTGIADTARAAISGGCMCILAKLIFLCMRVCVGARASAYGVCTCTIICACLCAYVRVFVWLLDCVLRCARVFMHANTHFVSFLL